MSEIAECPRGGQQGILVSNDELTEFAKTFKRKYIDEVIPLPNKTAKEQMVELKNCKHDLDMNSKYWESDSGSHGWCCGNCGTVLQWG